MRFSEFCSITETVGEAGRQYELKVYAAIQRANVPGLNPGEKPAAGFSSHGSGDIEATLNNKSFFIEVKLNKDAQMGSGSIIYDRSNQSFYASEKLQASSDPGDLTLLIQATKSKKTALDAWLDSLAQIEPISLHKAAADKGIPLVCSYDAWNRLKKTKALASLNNKLTLTADFIARLYNGKNVFYIQIGGAGLFYLGSNPLNLPVPKFEGVADIEFRLGKAGDSTGSTSRAFSKKVGSDTLIQARAAGYRVSGRFKSQASSPYTLDNVDSIKKLLSSLSTEQPVEPQPDPKSIQNLNKTLAASKVPMGQEPK
ncbi:MAG: hypothetical protein EBX47_10985 [Synechococcaceae bacterium WB8_1B_057]|nr:hypothetical protein [Synechococcaceae bacterium WB6_1A_059]NDG79928.1 hypothetical protein [Synechococcaceae bacterium WB8_1B_057]